jgi:hypothetical protein
MSSSAIEPFASGNLPGRVAFSKTCFCIHLGAFHQEANARWQSFGHQALAIVNLTVSGLANADIFKQVARINQEQWKLFTEGLADFTIASSGSSRSSTVPVFLAAWMQGECMHFIISDMELQAQKSDAEIKASDWDPPNFFVHCISSKWATADFLVKESVMQCVACSVCLACQAYTVSNLFMLAI